MPLKEMSVVDQREEFCRLASQPAANVSELCRRWRISRTTAYDWLRRFEAEGRAGLENRSRRPKLSPGRTAEAIEALVVAVRQEHPVWGGRKIRRVLRDEGLAKPPSISTITEILRRRELLNGPGANESKALGRFEYEAPNDLWQMDFKGHFATGAGRCHPLTVLDDHSRYSLEIGACANEQGSTVKARLEMVFRQHGLPRRILADNGPPWGMAAEAYTTLGVWLMDLGIGLIHGRPYHPQTQGKDERFHRTLKAEVLQGRTFDTFEQVQVAFDHWRPIYNFKRPHEGIGLATPITRYRPSTIPFPERIEPPQYEPGVQVRTVFRGGWISFNGRNIGCPKAFVGKRVALRPTDTDGVFDLCYKSFVLTQIDLRQNQRQPVQYVPEHMSTMSPV